MARQNTQNGQNCFCNNHSPFKNTGHEGYNFRCSMTITQMARLRARRRRHRITLTSFSTQKRRPLSCISIHTRICTRRRRGIHHRDAVNGGGAGGGGGAKEGTLKKGAIHGEVGELGSSGTHIPRPMAPTSPPAGASRTFGFATEASASSQRCVAEVCSSTQTPPPPLSTEGGGWGARESRVAGLNTEGVLLISLLSPAAPHRTIVSKRPTNSSILVPSPEWSVGQHKPVRCGTAVRFGQVCFGVPMTGLSCPVHLEPPKENDPSEFGFGPHGQQFWKHVALRKSLKSFALCNPKRPGRISSGGSL